MADEIKIESQDNVSELDILKKRIGDVEMAMGAFNPRNLAGLRTKDLQQATRANLFGDGSDGDVIISTEINFERDMFYNNLTVEDGGIINTKSFRIFTKDQFIKKPGGIVRNNGVVGVAGSSPGAGGAGGTAVASGSLNGGVAGSSGSDGGTAGIAGTAGIDVAKSLGSPGSGGGGGGLGQSGGAPGAGGAGGSQTGTLFNKPNSFNSVYYLIDILPSIVILTLSAGAGGGGGGSGSTNPGGGGGSGSPGGMIWIAANRMFIEGSGEIQCTGGVGGNGGNSTGNDGGGGGGAGGTGGVIILIYGEKSGTGTVSVTGGAGGTGGTGWHNGANGSAGQTGKIYNIQIQ